jgi:hypothetical protein
MKTFLIIILTLGFNTLHAEDSCKITYISNEGFLIETQGKKVLIDGLFDHTVFMHINPGNLETYSNHFKEVENITIFERKMDFIYYETSR